MRAPQIITISEFGSMTRGVKAEGYTELKESTFDAIENFLLKNKQEHDVEVNDFLSLRSRKGVGKVISAKNYVGVIVMKDATEIEILPKIYSNGVTADFEKSRYILLQMLKHMHDSPFKKLDMASVDTCRNLPIFEIFIRMFIDEVFHLQKHGFKSTYVEHEDNETFFKGKLLISQQLKTNYTHAEKFYVQYDEFNINRPANRLIKATLELLLRTTSNWGNKKDIRTLLTYLDTVRSSTNYSADFSKVVMDRNMKGFQGLIVWCHVFLMKQSFTSFAGEDVAYALLFRMNEIFESYVAYWLKKYIGSSVSIQDKKYNLFTSPKKRFSLIPDIVINKESSPTVLDTKWKLLNPKESNNGISQADMYQMYVYHKKYRATEVVLIYPKTEFEIPVEERKFTAEDPENVSVRLVFVDLISEDWKHFCENILK